MENYKPGRWHVFLNSVFFVLGFSLIFSIVGVLLQTVLSNSAYSVQKWLAYLGGIVIVLFGLYLLGLIKMVFLEREHKFQVKSKFKYSYVTSFIFGAAFAVGWTPCVSVALGAILALAVTNASSAFFLLFAYTLGLGIPFLLVGLFTNEAQKLISRAGKWLRYFQYFFGVVLVVLGVLVLTSRLSRIAGLDFVSNILSSADFAVSVSINSLSFVNLGVAFLAGLGSFLSPCILPLIPGFLSYLASTSIKKN
ncbi:MAG TPA: cytochrome c biogenesis protein CcdA [Candidatus Nanoarchaeia archaeon]|nr:cytochrome c biogenesis protein CcdA [Candidatus Nanoarchaeia archaeon]